MKYARIILLCLIALCPTSGKAQTDDLSQEDKAILQKLYDTMGGTSEFDMMREPIKFVLNYEWNLNLLERGGLSEQDRSRLEERLTTESKHYAENASVVLNAAKQISEAIFQTELAVELGSNPAGDALANAQERLLLQNYGVSGEQLDRLMNEATRNPVANVFNADRTDRSRRFDALKDQVATEVQHKGMPSTITALRIGAAAAGIVFAAVDMGVALGAIPAPWLAVPAVALLSASFWSSVKMWEVALSTD